MNNEQVGVQRCTMNEIQYKNPQECQKCRIDGMWWLTNEDDSLIRFDKIDLLFTHNLFCRDTSNSPGLNTLTIPFREFYADIRKTYLVLLMITQ